MDLSRLLLINNITLQDFIYSIVTFWVIIIIISEMRNYIGNQNTEARLTKNVFPLMYDGKLKITQAENIKLKKSNKDLREENEKLKEDRKTIKLILRGNK